MQISSPMMLERDMLPALGASLHTTIFSSDREVRTLCETPICGVIPDVLFYRWRGPRVLKLRRPATIIEAHILAFVELTGGCQAEELAERLFMSKAKTDESTRMLAKRGLLLIRRNGTLVITRMAKTTNIEVVAVEFKLRRWKEALVQAVSYFRFSNSVYVVLDGARVNVTAEIRAEFEREGVGLLLQRGSKLEESVSAKDKGARPTAERVIATHKALIPAYL